MNKIKNRERIRLEALAITNNLDGVHRQVAELIEYTIREHADMSDQIETYPGTMS